MEFVSLTSQTSAYLAGAALAGLLVCAGVALGWWLGRRMNASQHSSTKYLFPLLGDLLRWTDSLGREVSQCREKLDQLSQLMETPNEPAPDEPAPSEPGMVQPGQEAAQLLSEISDMNNHLQRRLNTAESTLKEQALEISAHITEARTDVLTGLLNRRACNDHLAEQFTQWRDNNRPFCLLLFDIDHFKSLNDQHGHPTGDAMLAAIAETLLSQTRQTDFVCRYGGEEFAFIMPNTEMEQGCVLAERVRQSFGQTSFRYEGKLLQITASGGIAQISHEEALQSLIKRADLALYAAKGAGRNIIFQHVENHCRPLQQPPAGVDQPPPEEKDVVISVPANFSKVCNDLRRRLLEVTKR